MNDMWKVSNATSARFPCLPLAFRSAGRRKTHTAHVAYDTLLYMQQRGRTYSITSCDIWYYNGMKRIRPHVNPLSILTRHTFGGFGDARPVVVDIGAYKGEFVAALADARPDRNYVVFEVRSRVADMLRAQFAGRTNVAVFDGDALRSFRTVLEPCQVQGAMIEDIYVNFPDPWPKDRHKKRRVVTEKFLRECQVWLDPRVTWTLQTDHKGFFDDTLALLTTMGLSYETFDDPPHGIVTDWERARAAVGAPIYRVHWWLGARVDDTAPVSAPGDILPDAVVCGV